MATKRVVKKACRSVPLQWCHTDAATSDRERARERERGKERETERRERETEKERESASTAGREQTCMATKIEVKNACRSVPSQWRHSDTTRTERERGEDPEKNRKRGFLYSARRA